MREKKEYRITPRSLVWARVDDGAIKPRIYNRGGAIDLGERGINLRYFGV